MAGLAFIDYPVTRRGGVLFVAAEGASEIPIRIEAVRKAILLASTWDRDFRGGATASCTELKVRSTMMRGAPRREEFFEAPRSRNPAARGRSGELSPALEGHLAKYRKLIPALALMNHLADFGQGAVSHRALLKALAFAAYLESHAKRVYAGGNEGERSAAGAILSKICGNELEDGFTAREIQRKAWAHLTDRADIQAGLDLLADLDHIAPSAPVIGERGGRPKVSYAINPRTLG
jgi:hypothetical protein